MTTTLTRPLTTRTITCQPSARPARPAPVGMCQAVDDGPLRFVALDAFRLYDAWCHSGDYARAKGQFLYVTLQVTNVSVRPQTFVADYQWLIDPHGHIVRPDVRAMSLAAARHTQRVLHVGPGATVRSLLIFDVADRSREADYRLSLHSSVDHSTACVQLARI